MQKALFLLITLISHQLLHSHCQMPCGIYDDALVFKYVDQYIETMQKGVKELNSLGSDTPNKRAQFIRWVALKEEQSNQVAELITTYFLQQVVKPVEESTPKVLAIHRLLFLLVKIKQNSDDIQVNNFLKEWTQFKQFFSEKGQ